MRAARARPRRSRAPRRSRRSGCACRCARRRRACAPGCARRPFSIRTRLRRRAARALRQHPPPSARASARPATRARVEIVASPSAPSSIATCATDAEIACVHRRAPHVGDGDVGSRRDRIDHHAGKRALPQLADEQAHQKLSLARGARAQKSSRSVSVRRAVEPAPRMPAMSSRRRSTSRIVSTASRAAAPRARPREVRNSRCRCVLAAARPQGSARRSRSRRGESCPSSAASSRIFASREDAAPTRAEASTNCAKAVIQGQS